MSDTATLLSQSRIPLIILPKNPTDDMLASAMALAYYFTEQEITPTVICAKLRKNQLPFITRPVPVTSTITSLQDFVLEFNTQYNDIVDIQTERTDGTVRVVVTPQNNFIDPRDFSFAPSRMHYDLIITIGGTIAELGTEFPELSEINNTQDIAHISFHHHNIICAEIAQIFHQHPLLLSTYTAHCLLSGIVLATDGLRNSATSSAIMHSVAKLMRHGADLQEIMVQLYKRTTLDFLKLWGLTLNNLQMLPDKSIAWTHLPHHTDYIPMEVLSTLMRTAQSLPQTHALFALWRNQHATHGVIFAQHHRHVKHLQKISDTISFLSPQHSATFTSKQSLLEFHKTILKQIT